MTKKDDEGKRDMMIPLIQIILGFIAAIIIIIIAWDYWRQPKKQPNHEADTTENSYEPSVENPVEKIMALIEEGKQTATHSEKSDNDDIIAFQIMPHQTKFFPQHLLLQTLAKNDFHYSNIGIFHRYADNTQRTKKLFNVASATEPGDFDLENFQNLKCSGLILFMSQSDHVEPLKVFREMVQTGRALADSLNAELKINYSDDLTPTVVDNIEKKIIK